MLFNCFHCGKIISSKKDTCVYCKTNIIFFAEELNKNRQHASIKETLQEKYSGTILSFLLKTKVR
ncbi:hypothetical protein HZA39_03280 [Candidatus Peregrinibacteria bacterium]|nr:hypothetical protein [Candidatus Peregrinibacteria bacterium]